MRALAVAAALSAAAVLAPSAARDTLDPSTPLAGNDTLVSAGGVFSLGFFTPPGTANRYVAIWYTSAAVDRHSVVWILNRAFPVSNGSTAALSMTADGALLVTDAAARRTVYRWPENFSGEASNSPAAQLLDTGNFVATDASTGGTLWQSFDYPTDTMIAGMKLGVDKATGKNWSLTAWTTDSDPSPSDKVFALEPSGDPEYFLYDGGRKALRTKPWHAGAYMKLYITSTIVDNATQEYVIFQNLNASLPAMIRANYTGAMQQWMRIAGEWSELYSVPTDPCDAYGACGLNGVCGIDYVEKCSCLPGFSPKNAADWNDRAWGGGCVRDTPLNCSGDGFAVVSSVKAPDTTTSVYTAGAVAGIEDCKAECLKNCSCTAVTVATNNTGCLLCFGELEDTRLYTAGQDLYVRLAAGDVGASISGTPITATGSRGSGGAPAALVVPIAVAAAAVLAAGGVCCYLRAWRKKRSANVVGDQEDGGVDLPLLDLETIADATDGFSTANKIGEGGFGPVYWGKLSDGQEIAIKRLAKSSAQGEEEFKNEVRLIAKLQHRNLVRLLGCCIHGDDRMLVYEFVPNGSLDAHLFGGRSTGILDWGLRYQIILGVARGLVYLHEDSRLRVIHRDLKASNILLDGERNPKISDFGMARIFGGDETSSFTTRRVVGTYGYMSPEYVMYGKFSIKSDVFSFGVLMLEIISGKRNGTAYESAADYINLSSHVWNLWKKGKALEVMDESLDCTPLQYEEVLKCLKLGLLCVQEYVEDRPTMSAVLHMIRHDVPRSALPEPKQPGFMAMRPAGRKEPPTLMYTGSFTITSVEGR